MGEFGEHQNTTQFQSKLAKEVAYIWYPNSEDDGDSIDLAIERMVAVQQLIQGNLHPDTFLDLIDSHRYNVPLFLDALDTCFQ
jgi:hypothetical protein